MLFIVDLYPHYKRVGYVILFQNHIFQSREGCQLFDLFAVLAQSVAAMTSAVAVQVVAVRRVAADQP